MFKDRVSVLIFFTCFRTGVQRLCGGLRGVRTGKKVLRTTDVQMLFIAQAESLTPHGPKESREEKVREKHYNI